MKEKNNIRISILNGPVVEGVHFFNYNIENHPINTFSYLLFPSNFQKNTSCTFKISEMLSIILTYSIKKYNFKYIFIIFKNIFD